MDDRLLEEAGDGFVRAVRWHDLYPGLSLAPESEETARWTEAVGVTFRAALVEANVHRVGLVFADLRVDEVERPG